MLNDAAILKELRQFTLLYVEDDTVTREYLSEMLQSYFYNVVTANNGKEAYEKTLLNSCIDIILTDINLPKENGLLFIDKFRKENKSIPVVFLSAYKNTETLMGAIPLNVSAFLVKPVRFEKIIEALADALRVKQNLAFKANNENFLQLPNGLEIDLDKKVVRNKNEILLLSKKEFELTEILVRNKKSILSRAQIEELLWNGTVVADSSVKTLIKKLRAKIGEDSIVTVKNLGYMIAAH